MIGRALFAGAVSLALVSTAAAPQPHARQAASARAPIAQPADLQPGDVVFIGVDGAFWAEMASASSLPAHRFGHVGIAARDERGALVIVHAGGAPDRGSAPVLAVPFVEFAAEADRVGIYRLNGSRETREAAARTALSYARAGLQFDGDFSLETRERLYCTELVWRAFNAAGADTVPLPSVMAGKSVVTLADLETSALLAQTAYAVRAELNGAK